MARFNRILLTGAAGALGTMLRGELPRLCSTLRISDREDMGDPAPSEEAVRCDLADRDAAAALTRDVDMIVHMGGIGLEDRFDTILHSNILGFYNLFEQARKNGVKRIVWGSSNHAIGFYPRTQTIDASVTPKPDTLYGVSKVFGEGLAQFYFDKFGMETVSIRIGSCFPEPVDRRMLGTWLSYRDLTQIVEKALSAPKTGHLIIYGASDNDEKLWDNRMASSIGYRPRDNAETFRDKVEAATPAPDRDDPMFMYHGGGYARRDHFEGDG